ncbi:MAG TPA: 1,4-dihydroxy-2-naphthoate octaprenyltransferase [Caldilineaceae bacterium]|nr:1,4-dihydroxy-2-naphthoate octaprenyltransferase [Caldilineaceae bacterium]
MKNRLLYLISPLALLVLWELLVMTGVLDRRFFPAPSETLARLVALLEDGTLVTATVVTLRRLVVGFLLATIPAVLIGLLMGISRTWRILLSPLIAALYPVPKIALVPMVVILLGIGEASKYAIVVISVFFLVVLNTMAGVLNVDERYFDIARNNGAKRWDLVWTVALPAALPSILTGVNLGLGFALTVIVGTELLLPQGGIGALIWQSYQVYDIATIFAGLIVVALLGWGFNTAMLELERQLLPWRAAERNPKPRRLENEPRLRRFIRTWWMAIRPFSFTASVTPVVLGSVLAAYDGYWDWLLFAITLAGSVAIHAGANLINDYYDWKKGTDTPETLGPNRALKEGMITPNQVFWGGVIFFAFGSLLGLYLVATRGLFILYLGIFSVLAGWFYTAGPAAFAYTGLGEVVVFIFMGPVMVLGSYFVQTQRVATEAIWLSAPVGLLVAAILHANNMRDLETDRSNKKRTLANLLGRQASRWEYYLLVGGSYLLLVLLVVLGIAPAAVLLAFLTLPMAVDLIRTAAVHEAPARLNKVLRGTATLHGRFGWLMIVGVIVAIAAQVA